MAPFFAISNANEMFARLNAKIFAHHANKHPDHYTSETWGGKIFLAWQRLIGEPQIFSSIGEPTYQQAMHLSEYGKKLWQGLQDGDKQKRKLKRYFIVPKYDNVACPKILKFFSSCTGAKFIPMKNWHNPLLESPLKTLQKIIKRAVRNAYKLGENSSSYAEEFSMIRNKTLRDDFDCGRLHKIANSISAINELNAQWVASSIKRVKHSSRHIINHSDLFLDQRLPAVNEVIRNIPQLIT